jgi:hypothetical protein
VCVERTVRLVQPWNSDAAWADSPATWRSARDRNPPQYLVADVTDLNMIQGPYDRGFDVGCFHCLTAEGRHDYVAEVARLLRARPALRRLIASHWYWRAKVGIS